MLHGRYDKAEEAAQTLKFVNDERVVPYFVRAVETKPYEIRLTAIIVLGKFKGDEALQGLKRGMQLQGIDFREEATTLALAQSLANNIRSAAAQALMKSPYAVTS
jgi:HEAT repeat protein